MSDFDYPSGLSSYSRSSSMPSAGGGNITAAQKQQVMEQVKNQIAIASAQELIQVTDLTPDLHIPCIHHKA